MRQNRRRFITSSAALGMGLWLGNDALAELEAPIVAPPLLKNERIRFACIGVGGKGDSDTADAARFGDIVAICDVDDNTLAEAAKKYPGARRYNDYRRMLDELAGQIDAVTVSTPDHHHAPAAAQAIALGKHCFCQKPLTHSLYEARKLAELARKHQVATQMGNQGTADSGLRRAAARLRAGVVGTVRELHVWTDRPIWAQGHARPAEAPVPSNLHWDLWLGPAPKRPYGEGYHTFSWRGFWDFGTGALGDMGCHTLNMPFMALDLRDPESVVAETSGHNGDSLPSWSIVQYRFRALKTRPALSLTWYDGGKKPPADLFDGRELEGSGALILGDKGKLYIPGDYAGGDGVLLGGVDVGEPTFPVSPGHFEEFVRAMRDGTPAMSNFPGYAGPLAEMVLVGNLAVWAGGSKVEWDAKRLRAKGADGLETRIRPVYQNGWKAI
jgi:predicted dehydrogenase